MTTHSTHSLYRRMTISLIPLSALALLTFGYALPMKAISVAQAEMQQANISPNQSVSMDMRNVNIVEIVQLLANSSGLNIVIPDDLQGEVTVKLKEVAWEDALDSILRTKGFGYQKQGTVLRIDALDRLKGDLGSHVFVLKYVDANDMKSFLEGMLSEHGKITTLIEKGRASIALGGSLTENKSAEAPSPQKSRILTLTDTQEVVDRAAAMIAQLDVEPKQIAIEVQIVEVVMSKNQDLGIKWNIEGGLSSGGTQPTTFPFPSGAVGGPFLPPHFKCCKPEATSIFYRAPRLRLSIT